MSTDSLIEPPTVSHFQREWRRRILNFTPSWFSVNMGTGIVSILLYNFPYQFHGLKVIAGVTFGVNVLLFFSFLGISIARYIIWPQVFKKMIFHPQQSLFLGTFPMGFGTIVNMTFYACVPAFGSEWITVAWVLWWIDSIVATIIAIGIPFMMFTRHKNDSASITAIWLQPSVSTIVSAASGAIIASGLPDSHARLTITISYILLGIGFMPALLIMGIYFQRLTLYKIPPNALIVSTFLPIGPCGQGAFAMLRLSSVIRDLCLKSQGTTQYSAEEVRMFGAAIYACTIPIAFVIWGFGLTWLCWAISSILNVARNERIGFNMGWWGFTFPLGVFSLCTLQLGTELESEAFKVLGTIFSGTVVLLWIYVASMTVVRGWTGVIFSAPCLGDCEATLLPKKEEHVEAK